MHRRSLLALRVYSISLFEGLVAVEAVVLPRHCHVGIPGLQDTLAMNYKYTRNISMELQRRFWILEHLPSMWV